MIALLHLDRRRGGRARGGARRAPAVARDPAAREEQPSATRQILLPFTGTALSRRALDAAMRLAQVEGATLMPAFLATVPLHLPLDAPLPKQCTIGMPLLEAIEQRAVRAGRAGRRARGARPHLPRRAQPPARARSTSTA